jgi:hypothetical protein
MPQQLGHLGANSVAVAGNKTLAITDQGVEQVVTANSVITLPSTVVGYSFTVVVGETSTGKAPTVSVSPAALDLIAGNGFTAADDKDAICSSLRAGDRISLVGNGTTGWNITSVTGTWTREA